MPDNSNVINLIRVVLGTPNDVISEREIVHRTKERVNHLLKSMGRKYELEVKDQSGVPPRQGNAQEVSQYYLNIEESDIFISIVWHRFGDPPGTKRADGTLYKSGTEEEVERAYQANLKNNGRKPRIMIYRKTDPLPADLTDEDFQQYGDLLDFLGQCKPGGRHPAYVYSFTKDQFSSTLEEHLLKACTEIEEQVKVLSIKDISGKENQPGMLWLEKVGLTENPFLDQPPEHESELARFPGVDLQTLNNLLVNPEPGFIFGAWGTGKSTLRSQLGNLTKSMLASGKKIYPLHFTATHFNQELTSLSGGWAEYRIHHFLSRLAKQLESEVILSSPSVITRLPELDYIHAENTISTLITWLRAAGGWDRLLCLVDHLDEIALVKSAHDPQAVMVHLLRQLMGLPKELGLIMRYFLPDSLEARLNQDPMVFRLDKGTLVRLEWNESDRLGVLARRMEAASNGNLHTIGEVFDPSQAGEEIDLELVRLAGPNLRAVLWMARRLFQLHLQAEHPADFIQGSTWEQVKAEWPRWKNIFYPQQSSKPSFNIHDNELFYDHQSVHLTPIEESLMQFLIDHLGKLCDRRMLSQAGWPDYASPDQVTDKQYSEAMRLLKKKVNQIAPNALENVPRKGYRLQAPPLGGVSGSENGG